MQPSLQHRQSPTAEPDRRLGKAGDTAPPAGHWGEDTSSPQEREARFFAFRRTSFGGLPRKPSHWVPGPFSLPQSLPRSPGQDQEKVVARSQLSKLGVTASAAPSSKWHISLQATGSGPITVKGTSSSIQVCKTLMWTRGLQGERMQFPSQGRHRLVGVKGLKAEPVVGRGSPQGRKNLGWGGAWGAARVLEVRGTPS